jgi:hypothetical protein
MQPKEKTKKKHDKNSIQEFLSKIFKDNLEI